MSISVKFGGYDFKEYVEEWREMTNIITDSAEVPGRDGSYIRGGRLGPREFELRGSLDAASENALRTLRNALRAGILKKTANLTILDDRYVKCRCTAYSDDYVPGSALLVLNFTAIFTSDLPYEQTVALQASGIITSTTSGDTDISVTNAGNQAAWVRITIDAPVSTPISNNLSVENVMTGKTFNYLGDIAAGESLVVDTLVNPPTVKNNGVDDIANFDGSFIQLDPGVNTIRVSTDVGAEILIEWRGTWI